MSKILEINNVSKKYNTINGEIKALENELDPSCNVTSVFTKFIETAQKSKSKDIPDEPAINTEEDIATQNVVEDESNEVPAVADNWTMRDDIHHWVVAGSYSTMSNAENAVATIVKRHSDIHCKIITLGKMYAVAIYGSSDRDDCVQYMRKYHKNFGEAWIFTPKEYR